MAKTVKKNFEGKDHYKVFFGPEITICKEALALERDSLIAQYMAASAGNSLTPDLMSDLSDKYKTCIALLHRLASHLYDSHGLLPYESQELSKDVTSAMTALEFAPSRKAEGIAS